jgi:hypothetical protein
MKTDKALRKILSRPSAELPYSFESRVMREIRKEAERKARYSYYRSLGLVAVVSLWLIGSSWFALRYFFHFEFPSFPAVPLPDFSEPIFGFSVYIGFLVLLLLGLDHLFRQKMKRWRKG